MYTKNNVAHGVGGRKLNSDKRHARLAVMQ